MNNKTGSWLMIFFLTGSIFSGMFVSLPNNNMVVKAGINPSGIFLIDEPSDYITAGLDPSGLPIYTPNSLIDFYMPIALKKEDVQNLRDSDVSHTILHGNNAFNDRFEYITFEILESSTYWIVLYHMKVKASTEGFSIDFVPKIKGEELKQFAWWSNSWAKRKDIFIDKDQVETDLPYYPILINISNDADMIGVQPDFDDVVFVNTDNTTQFPHEVEKYSIGADVDAIVWVNVTSVSDTTDTHLNMYYENGVCSNSEDPTNVWDTDYLAVYHMNSSTTIGCYDSTEQYHATYAGDINFPTTASSSIIGDAQYFDGDYIVLSTAMSDLLDVAGTIEGWYKRDDKDAYYQLYTNNVDASNYVNLILNVDTLFYFGYINAATQWNIEPSNADDTDFHYFVGAYQANDAILMEDSITLGTDSSVTMNPWGAAGQHHFGAAYEGSYTFDGVFDELRISKIRRNHSWLETGYNNMKNQSTFISFGTEETGIGTTNAVTSFTAETQSMVSIWCNWTQSSNGNYSHLERSTSSSWNYGDGTLLYNGTGTNYLDYNLSSQTVYYFSIWAFNESTGNFSVVVIRNNHTGPLNPTGITMGISNDILNVTWILGVRADITVITRKHNSFPSNIGDGTQIYNGSAVGYDDTGWNSSSYYTFYGYDSVTNTHSSGAQVEWGALQVRVYDENTSEIIYNYTVFITNASGTETYEKYSNGQQRINIDIDDLPTGDDVIVKINASVYTGNYTSNCEGTNCSNMSNTSIEYKDRIYIMDIYPNNFYNLSAYLPRIIDIESYIVHVIDDYGNPVDDAKIKFQRYINATVGFENVGIYHTDANGYVTVNLFPGETYLLNISKDGFDTANPFMYPIEILYIEDRYHTFKITYTVEDFDVVTFNTVILFCSETSWDTSNDTLHISFFDKLGETSDITIHVYESYETNLSFNFSYSYTNTYDIDIWVTGLNTSRMHRIKIVSMNHTTLGLVVNKSCDIMPIRLDDDVVTESDLESAFSDVGGDFSMGYVNMFILFAPSICIIVGLGYADPGFGVLVGGMYFILCSWHIELVDTVTIAALISMLIPLGIIVIAGKRGKKIT